MNAWMVKGVNICFGSQSQKWNVLVASIKDPLIIGMHFLCHFGAVLDFDKNTFGLNKVSTEFTEMRNEDGVHFEKCKLKLAKKISVPPMSILRTTAITSIPRVGEMVIVSSGNNKGLFLPNTLVNSDVTVPIQLVNDTDSQIVLRQGHVSGYAVTCDVIIDDCDSDWPTVREVNSVSSDELPEHLQGLYQRSVKSLTPQEAGKLRTLLLEYQDTFSKGSHDLGCFSEIKHTINTGDERPVKEAMRRTPLGFEKEEEENLKLMLDTGIITESSSDWASAPVLVRKKDGTLRYCVDFRKLNDRTVKGLFPLPSISQCIDQLSGKKYFSTLDMASGYWQIESDEKDRHKTAFITKHGLFEHKRMAFGLCKAQATFQRVIQFVLRGLTWDKLLAFLDDVIILGKDFEDHLSNLRTTFARFKKYNLKLKPKKCSLFHTKTLFLGRVVSEEGVSINPENVEKVTKWPVAKSVKDAEKFLGFINYHREHIKDYAKLMSVLYELTGSRATFSWKSRHQDAYETLKQKMVTAPILSYPNASDMFVLDTDASNHAIGAVLSQVQDDIERVVCYGSYVLTPEQRQYCVTSKELLAVVRFTRQFRHYLLGRKFLLRTDHNSLTWLLRFKYLEGQLARWLEELSQFDVTVVHRSGVKHGNADGMSRIPDDVQFCDCYKAGSEPKALPCGGYKYCTRAHNQWSRFEEDVDNVPLAVKTITESSSNSVWIEGYSKKQLHQAQHSDGCLQKIINWITTEVEPEQKELALSSQTVKYLYLHRSQLVYENELLYYRWSDDLGDKLLFVVPESLKEEVMSMNHNLPLTGHMGIAKTVARIKKSFIWYGLSRDVELFVKSCSTYNKDKRATVKPKAPLGQYYVGSPLERVHIDILGPFTPSTRGNQYVLMIVDQFTK